MPLRCQFYCVKLFVRFINAKRCHRFPNSETNSHDSFRGFHFLLAHQNLHVKFSANSSKMDYLRFTRSQYSNLCRISDIPNQTRNLPGPSHSCTTVRWSTLLSKERRSLLFHSSDFRVFKQIQGYVVLPHTSAGDDRTDMMRACCPKPRMQA